MSEITLVLMGAGDSTRFGAKVKKQWLRVGAKPLWEFVADRFASSFEFAKTIITASLEDAKIVESLCDCEVAIGGKTREESLKNALALVKTEWVLVSDIARALAPIDMIERVLSAIGKADSIAPALKVVDTIAQSDGKSVDRDRLLRVQTPQLSRVSVLREALAAGGGFSDETTLIAARGARVLYVEGSEKAAKLTYGGEIDSLEPPSAEILTGLGFDAHRFEEAKPLRLCGVEVASECGLKAHSDGDAALHALIDAILGACGLGDIGGMFPDSDAAFKGADSAMLLRRVLERIARLGFAVRGADITIVAEKPRLEAYKTKMRKRVAELLGVRIERVNVKATTTEKMGFTGRGEGIAAQAIASVGYANE